MAFFFIFYFLYVFIKKIVNEKERYYFGRYFA